MPDGSLTSLILFVRDRVTIVYRGLRGTRIADDLFEGTGYHTDGIADGPEGVDPLGAKGGLGGAGPRRRDDPRYRSGIRSPACSADPKKRLIVALDVSSAKEALSLVEDLDGIVSFYKLGWQLFMSGEWNAVLDELAACDVFIDLKLPGDIENTMESTVRTMLRPNVKLATLSNSMTLQGVRAAVRGRGASKSPKFLMVPLYSSLDASDLSGMTGSANPDVDAFITERAGWALRCRV